MSTKEEIIANLDKMSIVTVDRVTYALSAADKKKIAAFIHNPGNPSSTIELRVHATSVYVPKGRKGKVILDQLIPRIDPASELKWQIQELADIM